MRGRPVTGAFLGYLVVITATACWLAWRAVRAQRAATEYFGASYRLLGWMLPLAVAAVAGVWLERRYGVPARSRAPG